MNTQRLFNLILLEWSTEKLKIEDEMEKVIASDDYIGNKSQRIRELVVNLTTVEASIEKFNLMLQKNNNENEKQN